MKNFFLAALFLSCLICCNKSIRAQATVAERIVNASGPLDDIGLPHLFFIQDQLWDVNTGTLVTEGIFPGPVLVKNENILVSAQFPYQKDRSQIQIIDKQSLGVRHTIKIPGYLSWDRTHCLEIIEGDLWRSDIYFLSGSLTNKRQITELGIFSYKLEYQAWIGNLLVFHEGFGKPQFILNTESGELKYFTTDGTTEGVQLEFRPASKSFAIPNPIYSPDLSRAFVSIYKDYGGNFYMYDFNYQQGYGPFENSASWLTGDYLLMEGRLPPTDPSSMIGPPALYGADMLANEVGTLCEGCSPTMLSPNNRYGLEITHLNNQNQYSCIWDFTSGQKLDWPAVAGFLFVNGNGQYLNPIRWVNNTNIIYVQSGDLITQGTFIYDLSTTTKKKLSSKKATEIVFLPNTKYALYVIDNVLYRLNLETKETIEVTTLQGSHSNGQRVLNLTSQQNQIRKTDIRLIGG